MNISISGRRPSTFTAVGSGTWSSGVAPSATKALAWKTGTARRCRYLRPLRVASEGAAREITIAGFLLSQKRARAEWTGLTARVQNVAVEEHSFFDVTSDPGFRKYISGEVWLLGEIDRERLINIDRSSFNRECADYQVVQRVMARAIVEFKAQGVQRPQRQKVAVRRVLEDTSVPFKAIESVANRAAEGNDGRLPSSDGSRMPKRRHGIRQALEALDTEIVIDHNRVDLSYGLDLSDDGLRVRVTVSPIMLDPAIPVAGVSHTRCGMRMVALTIRHL